MNVSLRGLFDLHIHTAPDVIPRKCTDEEAAERMIVAGMSGGFIKCHHADTAARASALRERFPGLELWGGIALNRSVGGHDPEAVLRSARDGGRIVWFPTVDSKSFQLFKHRDDSSFDPSGLIAVNGEDGKLLPAVLDILDIAAEKGLIVGTGHLSPAEGMEIVREAGRRDCPVVLTHCDNPATRYSDEQEKEAAELGAFMEHCFYTSFYGQTPIEEIARQIRTVGPEHVILSSDFGQTTSPYFDEGLVRYMELLEGQGISRAELEIMLRDNPAKLLGI
ncbi:MAG: amidohydrolase family protein [Firmicutes bacterium]|nr:amidohydrolase family protein [Bacillota bacterium]